MKEDEGDEYSHHFVKAVFLYFQFSVSTSTPRSVTGQIGQLSHPARWVELGSTTDPRVYHVARRIAQVNSHHISSWHLCVSYIFSIFFSEMIEALGFVAES